MTKKTATAKKSVAAPRVTIRLTENLRTRYEQLAQKDNRKVSDYMRNVLRLHADAAKNA